MKSPQLSLYRILGLAIILQSASAFSASKHPFTVDDLLAMQRISEPALSPDGNHVVFTLRTTDLNANKGRTDIWLAKTDGSATRALTSHPDADTSPIFSADGKTVFFLSTRSGSSQVWGINLSGGEAQQVTSLPTDVNGFKVFPDGKTLLLNLEVFPTAKNLEDSLKREAELAKRPGNYKRYDQLLFRHWDQFEDGKRNHLFVQQADKKLIDLMEGMDADAPTRPFGGMEETAISPDGSTVVFAARSDGKKSAWTNNVDLFAVNAAGKSSPRNITAGNAAWDGLPTFSPDGKTLAYLAMSRPGYESDRTQITLMNWADGKTSMVAKSWDRSPGEMIWTRDGKSLIVSAGQIGAQPLFVIDAASGNVKALVEKGDNLSPVAGKDRIIFLRNNLNSPNEIWSMRGDGTDLKKMTGINDARIAAVEWGAYEQFSFPGYQGETVYGYVMKPAGWKNKGKAPVAFLIHGGPQGSFSDHFHYRWNPQIYAGAGYAVVFIDFHGSTGYGQAFTDSIRGNWGGAPYEDLMKGLDFALAKYSFLDSSRVFALGASYGGYMINWINGNTDRFKALVCHDGNLDEQMAYYDTEELWFPEWDHMGLPWEHPEHYQKHNPINLVKNWKTPTLVIHGGKDYRVVDTQGMATFTALQRKGIKSRFLHFPEENHWVLKPQNSKAWHQEVLGWMAEFR